MSAVSGFGKGHHHRSVNRLILAARSDDKLQEPKAYLYRGEAALTIRCVATDLGCQAGVERVITEIRDIDHLLLFNNAGVLLTVPRRAGLMRVIVNVSSLCAFKLFPSWVLYCSEKAARDTMFHMLAEEEPDLRVLNHAPGPLDTDMQLQARSSSADDSLRNSFSVLHAQGELLTCDQSISKLIKVLLEDKYLSGAHLDFYDL